jgi:hypothetical protein
MRRIAFFTLLVASSVTWSMAASAQSPGVAEYARASRETDKKAAKQQRKLLKKAAKQQRKGMKKYAKARPKAEKQANRRAR